MSIELTDFHKLRSNYSPLVVSEVDLTKEECIRKCLKVVEEWRDKSFNWEMPFSDFQQDYQSIANCIVDDLEGCLQHVPMRGEKCLAVFSKTGELEGIAITQKQSSKKTKTPFIKVKYLLTSVQNIFSEKGESQKVKGAGCALLAKAIKLEGKGKCLYLSSTPSAESFYVKMGFIPTKRQILQGYKGYKLQAKNFWEFLSKRAHNVSFA